MKTKEQIAAYNKEYFARPEVIARAKERNAQYRERRAAYKKTDQGKTAEKRYRQKDTTVERLRRNRIKTRYGLSVEDIEVMKQSQGFRCAICGQGPKTWHIDHCHTTNKVRGMLCGPCNMGLGLFRDDVGRLGRAKEYLDAV